MPEVTGVHVELATGDVTVHAAVPLGWPEVRTAVECAGLELWG